MKMFLWLIFLLVIGEFVYILFWQKERPLPRQTMIRTKNGRKTFIILRNK